MKDITEHLKDLNITETKKADLMWMSLGNGISVADRNQKENNDYKMVAHISDFGVLSLYDKNLDKASEKEIKNYAKQKELKAKNKSKLSKKVEQLIKKGNNFKVSLVKDKSKELEVRTVVIDNRRAYYFVNDKQLPFTHSTADVISLVGNGTYTLVESVNESSEFIIGQPYTYGQMACTVVGVNESVLTLDVDGETFDVDLNEGKKHDNTIQDVRDGLKNSKGEPKKFDNKGGRIAVITSIPVDKNTNTYGVQFWTEEMIKKGSFTDNGETSIFVEKY